ncbi:unnamed protein product, partial [Brenthis ino]
MCITFIYNGSSEVESDYSLILISNRDEFYDRPAQCMELWKEDPTIYGGRDLESNFEGGTWLAVAPTRKKIGVLLNIPGVKKENAKGRGKIVEDYVKNALSISDYISSIQKYCKDCNEFIFISVEFSNSIPIIKTYNNATDTLSQWSDQYIGFGNSLPEKPLKKVENGKKLLKDICSKFNKINTKEQLVEELIKLLKNECRNLPDAQLESREPKIYKELSSIFVKVPEERYGTRTHTILLVTKLKNVDLVEITMKSPINTEEPVWERNEFQFNI